MTSPKGFPVEGKREDLDTDSIQLEAKHSTVPPKGTNRRGLDTLSGGFFEVTAAAVVEAGSTDSVIKLTAHGAKKGDMIRVLTSANSIEEFEMFIDSIIDANNFQLAGACSADFATGDTFDLMRYVTEKLGPNGESLASVVSPPIQFVLDSVDTTVTEDTVTPANNTPLPVKLTGITGDINITANDLNVQTSHLGANADSVRIGDGVEEWAINASLEGTVNDADLNTAVGTQADAAQTNPATDASLISFIRGLLSSNQTDLAALLTELQLKADLTETQPVSAAALPLPAGAATQTTLAALLTELQLKADLTETQPVSAAALPLPAGAATSAAQASLLTELQLKADLTETQPISAAALPLPAGAATEATLLAQSAKLPSVIGQNATADSMSVVFPSDYTQPASNMDNKVFVNHDSTATNITSAAYVELIADTGGAATKKVKIFMSNGNPFYLAVGAAESEVDKCIVPPGGFPDGAIEISIPANSRLSAKALDTTIDSGVIIMNVMG